MGLADRLRGTVLRWNRLGLVAALMLPLAVSSMLGFLWLYQNGWLLWFALASVVLFAVLRVWLVLAQRGAGRALAERQLDGPAPDPDWTDNERAAFDRARARIAARLSAPKPWADLPAEALGVVEEVAADMSGGQRSALDFTLPEALLLIDRVALRYRAFLLRNVPYSDRLSVRTMHWLWRKQDAALTVWESGFLAWRGVRLVVNPAAALLREAERALASGLQARLTERFRRDAQAILLEEAAQAAIELYSGRLRTTDADLARHAAQAEARDLALAPPAVGALRIVLVGQQGVGKSTLVNALLGAEAAQTDADPDTNRTEVHEIVLNGTPCRLIDTPGHDGSAKALKSLVAEMQGADLVLWVHRANRPGRAPDEALARAYDAVRDPARLSPEILHVATGADLLIPGWPRPENALSAGEQARLDSAMAAIGAAVGAARVIPLRAAEPSWNIDALRTALVEALPAARRIHRARLRSTAASGDGVGANLKRAGRGAAAAARAMVSRFRR